MQEFRALNTSFGSQDNKGVLLAAVQDIQGSLACAYAMPETDDEVLTQESSVIVGTTPEPCSPRQAPNRKETSTVGDNRRGSGYRCRMTQSFIEHAGIEVPIICGAMYPCSNPELIAAVSEAGGIGIIQPVSMMYVHKHDLRDGIRLIRKTTDKPIGFNAIVEKSSQIYEDRMRKWVDIAIEEGVRFFVTALGNPRWVVDAVHSVGGAVYHNVTNRRWALKALDQEVDGLICVNRRAGGHAGESSPQQMYEELSDLGVPLICAGGIGSPEGFADAIAMGYGGVQMGTRFIATRECRSHGDYKQAILDAREQDIVLTEKISGVPVAVINTPFVQQIGTEAGWVARQLLQHPKGKHYMRMLYSLKSMWQLGKASREGAGYRDYFQAGKSVTGIGAIVGAGDVVREYAEALRA